MFSPIERETEKKTNTTGTEEEKTLKPQNCLKQIKILLANVNGRGY